MDARPLGVMLKYSYGSNAIGPSYMGAVAGKQRFEGGGALGVMFAYSGRKMSQGYRVGGGGSVDGGINDPSLDMDGDGKPDPGFDDWNGDGIPDNKQAIVADNLTQKPVNILTKIEYQDSLNSAIFSHRLYNNHIGGRKMRMNNYQANYRFSPDSPLINAKFLIAYNDSKQIYDEDAMLFEQTLDRIKLKAQNHALTLDLSNTSNFILSEDSNVLFSLGGNILLNEYRNFYDEGVVNDGINNAPNTSSYIGMIKYAFNPQGKQDLYSLYSNLTYNKSIFAIDTSFNLTRYALSTTKGVCNDYNTWCEQKAAGDFRSGDVNFNASVMLSAELHSLFTPFISFSRTHRAPNVQEMFYSSTWDGIHQDINTRLKAEQANTYQAGFNAYQRGALGDEDVFGFKAVYFHTKVRDFIYTRAIKVPDNVTNEGTLSISDNAPEAKFRGVEVELNYDAGFFYTRLSYSHQKSERPYSLSEKNLSGAHSAAGGQYSELPEDYGNLDLGIRLFDESLTLGGVAKYTGKAKRINPSGTGSLSSVEGDDISNIKTEDLPKIPTIIDIYAIYEPIKNLNFKLEVQNVGDKNYMDALYAYNSTKNQAATLGSQTFFNNQARGRTFIGSFVFRY